MPKTFCFSKIISIKMYRNNTFIKIKMYQNNTFIKIYPYPE